MPGYNHYPWCTCGWCSGGNGGGGWPAFMSGIVNIAPTETIFSDPEKEAKTYSTTCWWCGETVFYHSNGNGDSVLFDSLGWPWEIHSCWTDYSEGNKKDADISYKHKTNQCPPKPSLYFNQIANLHTNNSFASVSETNHRLLFGAASLVEGARVGKYSVFGLDEVKLSQYMSLEIEAFRQAYGEFYTRYDDGDVSVKAPHFPNICLGMETKTLDEKYDLIVLVIKGIPESKIGEFGFYGLTEDLLAKSISLSIKTLKLHFGQIYTLYSSGKIYFPLKPPKQVPKPPLLQNKKSIQKVRCRSKSNDIRRDLTVRRNKFVEGNSSSSSGLMSCPHCDNYVSNSKDKLSYHIRKYHSEK